MRCSYELYIYGNTNNFDVFAGFLCKTGGSHTIEN